jgi:hypothetical protein
MIAENADLAGPLYLDTSVLRSIGRGLASLGQLQLRTSALAIVELVSAATSGEGEFKRIRPGFEIMTSGSIVSIDWSLPDHYQTTSFDWMKFNCRMEERRLESLRAIADLLRSAGSLDDFLAKEAAASLKFPLDYWREYDFLFGKAYIESSHVNGQAMKDAFDRTHRGEGTVGPASGRLWTPATGSRQPCSSKPTCIPPTPVAGSPIASTRSSSWTPTDNVGLWVLQAVLAFQFAGGRHHEGCATWSACWRWPARSGC